MQSPSRTPPAVPPPRVHDWLVVLGLLTSVVALTIGVSLPLLHTTKLFVFDSEVSLIDLVLGLADDGEFVLAGVVAVFSILMPAIKTVLLHGTWWGLRRGDEAQAAQQLSRMEAISKLSMVDVMVVALIVFMMKDTALINAELRQGFYAFLVFIASSTAVSFVLKRRLDALASGSR